MEGVALYLCLYCSQGVSFSRHVGLPDCLAHSTPPESPPKASPDPLDSVPPAFAPPSPYLQSPRALYPLPLSPILISLVGKPARPCHVSQWLMPISEPSPSPKPRVHLAPTFHALSSDPAPPSAPPPSSPPSAPRTGPHAWSHSPP
ncbi:PREDICTED: vegetative cell wall protein gp1-like [Chinchilla lanigera]|uniref:vegetative cell wall protein gp1-like n=1 Tax=Chinchilla lanigera TaxID=34839 RepID=UPI000696EB97|nr:PREDICTED: vegetative cell wall protein gp1-like [Chinchilla lanigera]